MRHRLELRLNTHIIAHFCEEGGCQVPSTGRGAFQQEVKKRSVMHEVEGASGKVRKLEGGA